jgi:small subunit ribosomal protein S11
MVDIKKNSAPFEFYFGPFTDRRVAAFHINQKRRNLFFTVTDLTGSVIGSISAKPFAANRKKRTAPHIIELLIRRLSGMLKAYRVNAIRIFLKASQKRVLKPVQFALRGRGLSIVAMMDLVPVAHNGCRAKKARRL